MTPQEFIAKWQPVELKERSACQEHFLDLCELLGQQKPAAADPTGEWFCFEKGAEKSGGENGWADVWMKDHFAWEYKGKHKDLKLAYNQLLQYRESLDNPPLLVVCDLNRFEIHTNFTGTAKKVYSFDLNGLAETANLDVLRRLFKEPESLKPGQTSQRVTEEVAEYFGKLADGIRDRGVEAHEAARFLMKLMFCMFAEDIKLLPGDVFSRSVKACQNEPGRLSTILKSLFQAMATGGNFGADEIQHFNGGLFSDSSVIDLTAAEIKILAKACEPDWGVVEPHIFGTLFERTLDPAKRSQIGAHYTSSEDILTLLEPVMMASIRREWQAVKEKCGALLPKLAAEAKKGRGPNSKDSKPKREFTKLIRDFIERLAHVTVLDPACGSGNFLYVALRLLLDLEKEVITFAAGFGLGLLPQVRPTQLSGIEINPFAQELAQVVIWIGYLQWMRDNGFSPPRDPVLEPIDSIENRDAIIDLSDQSNPKEPVWPAAEFIVGNPPFLGGGKIRSELGNEYTESLFQLYGDRIPNFSDLCCYWFEKSSQKIADGEVKIAGLLATQAIRGGANRQVLKRITEIGNIFWAESDRNWILDGAAVHVSMIGFDRRNHSSVVLDGKEVSSINPDLTSAADVTKAKALVSNLNKCFMGPSAKAPFDIDEATALHILQLPANPCGLPNSDVLRIVNSAIDLVQNSRAKWTIDFGLRDEANACRYEAPFEYVRQVVKPAREGRRDDYRGCWWQYARPRVSLRESIRNLHRYILTPGVAKHRIFVWRDTAVLSNQGTLNFAFDSHAEFGILHSKLHEVWALAQGTQLREKESGFRYTPTTCFETFPFPEPTTAQREAIAAAAKELDTLRSNWLNPPEWTKEEVLTFPGSVDGPWARFVTDANSKGIGTVRYPRTVPIDAAAAKKLAKRTLTNLYNERPTWLDLAHRRLDEAVFAAYGWPADLSDEQILERLLRLNLERASTAS